MCTSLCVCNWHHPSVKLRLGCLPPVRARTRSWVPETRWRWRPPLSPARTCKGCKSHPMALNCTVSRFGGHSRRDQIKIYTEIINWKINQFKTNTGENHKLIHSNLLNDSSHAIQNRLLFFPLRKFELNTGKIGSRIPGVTHTHTHAHRSDRKIPSAQGCEDGHFRPNAGTGNNSKQSKKNGSTKSEEVMKLIILWI